MLVAAAHCTRRSLCGPRFQVGFGHSFLKAYDKMKTDTLPRLYYSEKGFSHIERGIRMAELLSLDKDLPRKIVTNGVEIHFKYTGQPITCYRCGSAEHVVQHCPQKARFRRNPSPPGDNTACNTETATTPGQPDTMDTAPPQSDDIATPASYADAATPVLFPDSQDLTEPARNCPPSSPVKDDNPSAKKTTVSEKIAVFEKTFLQAVKERGPARTKLMHLVSSRLFVIFVILNHATDFFINSTSNVGAQTKTWHSFYLGQMVICGGYTTLPFCPFGSDIAIVSFRRRFFGRRLLYSSNGTSSFNPSTLQLILSGDIHPHPGPGSRKYQSIQFSRECKESESSMTINQYANQSNIKMAHLNIRSLKSREHFILLQHTIEEHKFDIFTLSETWLDSTVDSHVMQIPGFQFFRQDRGDHKSGGGLGIFIRDTFEVSCFEELSTVSNDNFQQLWIKVQVQKCKSLILCTVYRPPNTSMACIEALTCNFVELLHLGYDIIILGDLNCDLTNDTTPSRIISDFCDTLNLVQLVNEPTRITEFTQTVIDLVMTTNTNLIDSCSVLTSSISDHSLIEVVMKLRKPRIKPTYITTRSYSSYDKKSFLQDLEYAPWHMVNFF